MLFLKRRFSLHFEEIFGFRDFRDMKAAESTEMRSCDYVKCIFEYSVQRKSDYVD